MKRIKKALPPEVRAVALSFVQRLNLHAVLGAQHNVSVNDVRSIWKLQERIALSPEEESAIDLTESADGKIQWNVLKSTPDVDYDFKPVERHRITAALKSLPVFSASPADRKWLEPLLDEFLPEGDAE